MLEAGGRPSRVVFSGVGKTKDEMAAALKAGILMFNVESREELEALDEVGRRLKVAASFSVRVNPNVDARTHRYIATGLKTSKFGVPFDEAVALYRRSRSMKGFEERSGSIATSASQLTELSPVREAVGKVAGLYRSLQAEGLKLTHLDVGGGIGIRYTNEKPPSLQAWARRCCFRCARWLNATLVLEPGRVIVGNAALLLTRVLYRKRTATKTFVIVDAGMNDLIRPALYEAHHEIVPVRPRRGAKATVDVVGPVCESSDVLGFARRLPPLEQGDLLAVMTAGAYGMSMSSQYNSRLRPAEVLVDGRKARVIRRREKVEDLWRGEGLRLRDRGRRGARPIHRAARRPQGRSRAAGLLGPAVMHSGAVAFSGAVGQRQRVQQRAAASPFNAPRSHASSAHPKWKPIGRFWELTRFRPGACPGEFRARHAET